MAESPRTEDPFVTALHKHLPQVLPEFLAGRRWFGGKARRMRAVEVLDVVPVDRQALPGYLVLVRVSHDTGTDDIYDVPLVRLPAGAPASIPDPASILTFRHEAASEDVMLVDALSDDPFLACLLDAIAKGATFPGTRGEVRGVSTKALAALWQPPRGPLAASLMKAEQSNSSVVYGQRFVLKIFRRVEEGINPDLEIGLYLTEHTSFQNVPAVAGHLEYLSADGARTSLGELQGYVANQGDAWQFTVRALAEYYEKARQAGSLAANEVPQESILALAELSIPAGVERRIGPYLESAALLGRRTAELHMALASARKDPAFTPAPLSEAEQQAFATSALQLVTTNFGLLRFEGRGRMKVEMPDPVRRKANTVLSLEGNARQHFQRFAGRKLSAMLTRIHGDYHLGQLLFTGDDFVLIDFEGEPARSLEERRQKRSPLQDVAGMLRSFHYAAYAPLLQSTGQGLEEDLQALGRWAYYWQKLVSAAFLKTYLEVSRDAQFIPQSREELAFLLDAYVLDKAVYELGYELNNRPSWLRIPLEGIAQLLLGPGEALL